MINCAKRSSQYLYWFFFHSEINCLLIRLLLKLHFSKTKAELHDVYKIDLIENWPYWKLNFTADFLKVFIKSF